VLFGPKVDVQVEVDRVTVTPGDKLDASVRVVSSKDVEIEEGRLELLYENEYTYRTTTGMGRDEETSFSKDTDRVVERHARFVEASSLTADTPYDAKESFTIPDDAPGSGEGEITKVRWKVVATLARHHARDIHGEARLTVLSRAGGKVDAPEVETRGDCELSLRLDRTSFGPGDTVGGVLVANPLQACEMSEVRVELVRHEWVPRDDGHQEDTKEADASLEGGVSLSLGAPREWPFQLRVPDEVVPCLRTRQSTVTWLVKGIGSRRMRPDYRVTQPVDVHTATS
jgi:hypothetical protein